VTLWNKTMPIGLQRIRTMTAGRGDFNFNRDDPRWEIWPKALEAGYARGAKWLFGVEFYRDRTVGTPNIELALRAVSGANHHIELASGMSRDQVFRYLGAALNEQKVVIAGTADAEKLTPVQQQVAQKYGLQPNHAYAVLGLNAKNDTVWLGNPHGYTQSVPTSAFRAFFPLVGWGYIP
jgi:hypothetical protein